MLRAGSVMGLDQVAQGFSQTNIENVKLRRLHNLSGHTAPLIGCSHGEKVFPYFKHCWFMLSMLSPKIRNIVLQLVRHQSVSLSRAFPFQVQDVVFSQIPVGLFLQSA